MTFEEKEKIIYETYKKRSKKWSYKCDVFVFNTPKSFSNLFLNNEVIFDSLWVERREVGYTRVWVVCVSPSGVVFGQLYYIPMYIYDNMESTLLVNTLEKFICFHEKIKSAGFLNLTNDSDISKRIFDEYMKDYERQSLIQKNHNKKMFLFGLLS